MKKMLMLVLSGVVLVAFSACVCPSEKCEKKSEKPACVCGCGAKSSCGTKCGKCGTEKKADQAAPAKKAKKAKKAAE